MRIRQETHAICRKVESTRVTETCKTVSFCQITFSTVHKSILLNRILYKRQYSPYLGPEMKWKDLLGSKRKIPIFAHIKQSLKEMARFVNPFTDIGFKVIFGQPASKGLLITLLNELLQGEHHIEDLSLLDKEDHADNVTDKGIIYDLYCRTNTGEYIIVEMQNRWHSCFLDRTLFYVCRAVGRLTQLPRPMKSDYQQQTGNIRTE